MRQASLCTWEAITQTEWPFCLGYRQARRQAEFPPGLGFAYQPFVLIISQTLPVRGTLLEDLGSLTIDVIGFEFSQT